jgi:enamine deaminase RidA (YjgF/YER057c/UK114 family)
VQRRALIPRKLLAELRIQIHGTKNAHTTLRNHDVVLYKLDPPVEECVRGIGVYQADQTILPLYCRSEGSNLFSADYDHPLSATALNEQKRLLRVVSSDRSGCNFIIEEYLDNDIYAPLLDDSSSISARNTPTAADFVAGLKVDTSRGPLPLTSSCSYASVTPQSKSVVAGGLQFLSGIVPVSGEGTGQLPIAVSQQAELCFAQLAQTLAGDLRRLCKVTFYLQDIDQSEIVRTAFSTFLAQRGVPATPAVTYVGVRALPQRAQIQIDAIALAPLISI